MSAVPLPVRVQPAVRTWNACPVCANPRSEAWVCFDALSFVRCVECGCVFKASEPVDVRPDDFYEQSYFHGRKSGRDKRFEHRVRKARGQILGAIQFGDVRRVLDVGCSFGYIVEAARRMGFESAGTDISQYAVDVCRDRGLRAEVGTLERLPFERQSFDLMILRHVLEHTPTPKQALEEVRRVLAPGGVLLVAVPDLDYWKGRFLRRSYRYFRPDDLGQQHYVYYTRDSLRRLLEGAGFEVRVQTKALFRHRLASQGPLRGIYERVRFAALSAWQALAGALLMRRELYMIATLSPQRALESAV